MSYARFAAIAFLYFFLVPRCATDCRYRDLVAEPKASN